MSLVKAGKRPRSRRRSRRDLPVIGSATRGDPLAPHRRGVSESLRGTAYGSGRRSWSTDVTRIPRGPKDGVTPKMWGAKEGRRGNGAHRAPGEGACGRRGARRPAPGLMGRGHAQGGTQGGHTQTGPCGHLTPRHFVSYVSGVVFQIKGRREENHRAGLYSPAPHSGERGSDAASRVARIKSTTPAARNLGSGVLGSIELFRGRGFSNPQPPPPRSVVGATGTRRGRRLRGGKGGKRNPRKGGEGLGVKDDRRWRWGTGKPARSGVRGRREGAGGGREVRRRVAVAAAGVHGPGGGPQGGVLF